MEFNEQIEGLFEKCLEEGEQPKIAKDIAEDFFGRLEKEKIKAGDDVESKVISFGSSDQAKDCVEKYEKAKEEYKYRVEQLEKSLSKGEKSYNEAVDVKYAKKAVERAEIDLKYAKKQES